MTIDAVHDRRLVDAGDRYEDKYRPDWIEEVNLCLERYGLRIRQVLTNSAGIAAQVVYEQKSYTKYYMTPWQPDEEQLYRLVYETLEVIDRLEEPMNIFSTPLFEYLSGEMIGDNDVTLTVKDVEIEELTNSRGTERKPVMTFVERDKKFVLNKTNARTMAAEAGPETDNWRGMRVVLHAPYINAFGDRMRSVQVKKVMLPAKGDGEQAADEEE